MLHYSKILAIATVLAVVPWVSADIVEINSPAQYSSQCIGKPIKIAYDVLYRDMAIMTSVKVNFVSVNGKTRFLNIANSKRPSGAGSWKYSKSWPTSANLTPGDYKIEFNGKAVIRKIPSPGEKYTDINSEEYTDINSEQLIKLVKCH
ncbi:hypothetical protein BDF19DRAFT_436479 [Syncephalis fuscata]|nr:hypothetical protein BDF19DRAFT_436479 [Syncephalis fuscata]